MMNQICDCNKDNIEENEYEQHEKENHCSQGKRIRRNMDIESTDVMTGDRNQKRFLYYQLKMSMQHAKQIDIIVSFFDGIRCQDDYG